MSKRLHSFACSSINLSVETDYFRSLFQHRVVLMLDFDFFKHLFAGSYSTKQYLYIPTHSVTIKSFLFSVWAYNLLRFLWFNFLLCYSTVPISVTRYAQCTPSISSLARFASTLSADEIHQYHFRRRNIHAQQIK